MSSSDLTSRLDAAKRYAKLAGRATLNYFQRADLQVDRKQDRSPVTQADRECEQQIRSWIQDEFPDDAVLGEEFGETQGQSGYRWILDPIDGTKSFISGVPLFGTMVAVEREGSAVIGVVAIPGLDEMVYAATGSGCWHQLGDQEPTAAQVSAVSELGEARIVTTESRSFYDRGAHAGYETLDRSVQFLRTWGDCYGYVLVATGRVEAMIDPILNVWDAAAVQPIITEAGGRFTDWSGVPAIDTGDAVGSNGLVHDQVLQAIQTKSD